MFPCYKNVTIFTGVLDCSAPKKYTNPSVKGFLGLSAETWVKALKGIDLITAVCLVAEIGEFGRFKNPLPN